MNYIQEQEQENGMTRFEALQALFVQALQRLDEFLSDPVDPQHTGEAPKDPFD
jgi:hypothetical protein